LEHLGDMSFYNFMEIYHPEVDIGSLTYWEIGENESTGDIS
jgi:hypothetical protein